MSIQQQIMDAISALIDARNNYATIVYGALPATNGLCMAASTGSADEVTLAHGGQYSLSVVLNGKHSNQRTVYDTLCSIHEYLNKLFAYPSGTGWAVCSIQTNASPGYIDREESQWLYGSSLTIAYIID